MMIKNRLWIFSILLISTLLNLTGCESGQPGEAAGDQDEPNTLTDSVSHNTLTEKDKTQGWILLFDGKTTGNWRVYQHDTIRGWAVENGELIALGQTAPDGHANDIITGEQYENFELSLEWKVSPEGNSGIFFHVLEDERYREVHETGPEYQIVDDYGWPEELEDWQHSAANYGLHPPEKLPVKPAGTYNSSRLRVKDGQVTHWLNGEKVVEYQLWTPEWEVLVRESKWKDFPGYGKASKGHIALQDHGNKIWFRNIKIKKL